MQLDIQLQQTTLGRARVTFSCLHIFILPIKRGGVFGVGLDVFLSLFWSIQNYVAADSEIGSENCVAADSEIGNENCVAANSKIGSKNCIPANSRNW